MEAILLPSQAVHLPDEIVIQALVYSRNCPARMVS